MHCIFHSISVYPGGVASVTGNMERCHVPCTRNVVPIPGTWEHSHVHHVKTKNMSQVLYCVPQPYRPRNLVT